MKISGYMKSQGHNVDLILDYKSLRENTYDKIYMSKVFTDTEVPQWVLDLPNITYDGTGFYYDKAHSLPDCIEHHKPDYHLYVEWIKERLNEGVKPKDLRYYTDYSIGFSTRGCFRKCKNCVNQNYDKVYFHSPVEEFLDKDRKYICLLDDNILGYKGFEQNFNSLKNTGKRFEFKQGMDIRLLNEKNIKLLNESHYIGDYIFAFDNINDKDIIERKLSLWRKYSNKSTKLYVFCAYDRYDKWDNDFWVQDIIDTFERIKILMKYSCLPYIMKFNKYNNSLYRGMYINLSAWCNQPNFYKKKSFKEWCIADAERKPSKICSTLRYMEEFEKQYPEIAEKYFDLKYEEIKI
jgi:hypothetical protein